MKTSVLFSVGALSVAGVIILVTAFVDNQCDVDSRSILLDASRDVGLEPRWHGCFSHRNNGTIAVRSPVQTRGALGHFERTAVRGSRTALSNLGAALALAGDTSRGITTIETLLVDQEDSGTLSNLAAAHLIQAGREGSDYDAVLALEHAAHAVALDSKNDAARYNEGLALTRLRLDAQADAVWRAYLKLDPDSAWSDRVRTMLEGARRYPSESWETTREGLNGNRSDIRERCRLAAQECREELEEALLPAWGSAVLRDDAPTATALLAQARALADVLAFRGDHLDADGLTHIELTAASNPRVGALREIAAGFEAYGRAREAFERDEPTGALFEEAERRLTASGNPLSEWVFANRVYAAFSTFDSAQLETLGPVLSERAMRARTRQHTAVAGRLYYLAALTFSNRSRYAPAEPLFTASLTALAQAQEREHLAATEWAVGNMQFRLGDSREGWKWFVKAFESLRQTPSARRRYVVLLNAGIWLLNQQLNYAAVQVLASARDEAQSANQPNRVAEALFYRARGYLRIKDFDAARADIAAAVPDAARNGRWAQGDRSRNEFLAGLAEIESSRDPTAAIAAASEALTFFEGRGFAARVAELRLLRGRAHKVAGNVDSAAADFEAGIATYEAYRRSVPSEQLRVMSQDVVWALYEEHLALATDLDPHRALAAAERGRARTLLDAFSDQQSSPQPSSSIEEVLNRQQRVVYYATLDHELLTWVIAPGSTRLFRRPIDRASFERSIRVFANQVSRRGPPSDWQRLAEQLFTILIGPVESALTKEASLILVPDGTLNLLPFAALRDPRKGQYLIEQFTLTLAPSVTIAAKLLTHPSSGWITPTRILVAGGPVSDAGTLPPLTGATVEAENIARLYPQAESLLKERATKASFVARMPDADVVHFAGHAIANSDYPLLAHLEFSIEPGVTGGTELSAEEIARLSLSQTRLVVLAACRTGIGALRRGEGVLSLARPFLIAGVPSVIGTLWDIEDREAAHLLVALHQRLVQGLHPSTALRRAQLSVITDAPASVWAAFTVIGRPDQGY